MLLRACMRGLFLKAASPRKSWKISAAKLAPGGGLSSYPHPWLMPDLLGISDRFHGTWARIMAIYHARFIATWKIAA